MDRPVYFLVRPPEDTFIPGFDWFPTIVKVIGEVGHSVASSDVDGETLTVRTDPSATFIPAIVRVRRTPEGFLFQWTYPDVPRVGVRQKLLGGWAEDSNRLIRVFRDVYRANVRQVKPEEGERSFPSRTIPNSG